MRGAMILDSTIPGVAGWDESMAGPGVWHVGFMQVPGLSEKLITGRVADYLDYFSQFAKFSSGDKTHYVKAYETPAQRRAAFEIYRAFPANVEFNRAQRRENNVPLFVGAGEKSPFAMLIPKIAEGLRSDGFTHVQTRLIRGAVHYVVEDQPEAVTDLIERYASAHLTE